MFERGEGVGPDTVVSSTYEAKKLWMGALNREFTIISQTHEFKIILRTLFRSFLLAVVVTVDCRYPSSFLGWFVRVGCGLWLVLLFVLGVEISAGGEGAADPPSVMSIEAGTQARTI
jgi:hypothetical protein